MTITVLDVVAFWLVGLPLAWFAAVEIAYALNRRDR